MNLYNTVAELLDSGEYKAGKAFMCNMPFSEYRKAPGISQSQVKDWIKCAALYQQRLTQPLEATPAMILGSYFDARITGDQIDKYIVMQHDGRTKEGKTEMEMAQSAGLQTISKPDADNVERWVSSAMLNRDVKKILDGAEFQTCGFAWFDGVPVKGRADVIRRGAINIIADLKLVADGSPEKFSRDITEGYDIQAAMYQMIFGDAFGVPHDQIEFTFICQEKHEFKPTGQFTGVYGIDLNDLAFARGMAFETVRGIDSFTKLELFPGYGSNVISARWPRERVKRGA